jgi:hypothetical protein
MTDRPTLVIGASPNPDRYSFRAAELLLKKGHTTIPFGKRKGEISGVQILNDWNPEWKVHTITLYLNPSQQSEYYDKILSLRPQRVLFNPGTENPEFERLLEKHGIEAIESCTLVMLSIGNY